MITMNLVHFERSVDALSQRLRRVAARVMVVAERVGRRQTGDRPLVLRISAKDVIDVGSRLERRDAFGQRDSGMT